ncbi:hypothetical protein F5890DRAFT_1479893 [Lentinula detonsa]|uniref:F-box domain-containing protein n=1 Tax=Lentinula detonsa TaxID=2804962 RepID=A0AA38QAQ8_9AGAR|nr:hypothetical protein F5890DRAFT_1479893 [Lentinula detonsa]
MEKGRLATLDTDILILDAQLEIFSRREADIQRVLDQMNRMHDVVVAERKTLEAKRKELIGQRQPINWLPGEILIEIFSFICGSPDENEAASIVDQDTLINVTHTCSKWRTLALSTSRLWSLIHIPCTGWNKERVSTFIARSSDAPLDVIFGGLGCFTRTEQCTPFSRRLSRVQDIVMDNLSRLRYLSIDCMAVDTAAVFMQMLNSKENQYPLLSFLSLAITREVAHPASFPDAQRSSIEFFDSKEQSGLKNLRLQRIPLLSLSPRFYSSLTTLDISLFSKLPLPNSAPLKDFMALLSMSRQLVHLSLSIILLTTTLYVTPLYESIQPVVLPFLKHIDLNFGHPVVLPRLFSHITAVGLEKIELWLTGTSSNTSVSSVTPSAAENQWYSTHQNLYLSSLKDMSLQFIARDQDLLSSSLRYFSFPVLQKLEIVNTDPDVRDSDADSDAGYHRSFPPIPRFESFFRDPRFLVLTHLSLSHFLVEDSKVDALLGYVPALTSLSLDTVKNCDGILESLTLRATLVAPGQSLGWMSELVDISNPNRQKPEGSQRRMKFCSKLEALSLWGCDPNFATLYSMMKARNDPTQDDYDYTAPYTTVRQSLTALSKRPAAVLPARRVIKPLRKSKLVSQTTNQEAEFLEDSTLRLGVSNSSTATVLASPVILQAMQASAAQPPSRISYLRLARCRDINDRSVGLLEKLVDDVVWSK